MKIEKMVSILFVLLFTFSCKRDDTINVYNEKDFYENKGKKIKIIDTLCINEEKKALENIRNGKIYITREEIDFRKSYSTDNDYQKIEILLLEKGIRIDTTFLPDCFGRPEGFKKYCYQLLMQKEISKRYGSNFIDSLKTRVEKEFVLNNADFIYDMHDCDRNSIYPDENTFVDFFDEADNDFKESFEYPKGYNYKNEENYSFTNVDFIISKKGEILNLKVASTFQNPDNEKYKSYFENFMKKFIIEKKWTPASCFGIIVNGNFRTVFFHK